MRILHLANHVDRVGNGIVNAAVDLAWYQAQHGHEVAFASRGGALVELLARGGLRHHVIPQRDSPQTMVRATRRLRRLCVEYRPDIVHAHMVTGALLARATRGRLDFALVCSVQNEWQRQAVLMQVGDAVVAVSEANSESLHGRGVPQRKLHVVRNAPLGSPRLTGEPVAAHVEHPAVVTVAGLFERKGLKDLLRAFELLDPSQLAHLYIVGEGPYREELERLLRASPTRARVHLEGFCADPRSFMMAGDVFVLASHREPFGLVLAEARALGRAIVGADIDGIPEVLEHGRAGVLVPTRDPAALADAIGVLLSDAPRRQQLGRAAQENLDWLRVGRMAEEMLAVYSAALASRRTRRSPA